MTQPLDGTYVSKGYAELNGQTLFTSQAIGLTQNTNSDDVDPILDEAGGFAQGTVKYELKIEGPVPSRGFEIDWFAVASQGRLHQLRFVLLNPNGGPPVFSKLLKGVFRDPAVNVKANSAAAVNVTFHGREVAEVVA